ncbi:MAG: acetate kinase [Candidatus Portnoybacteria bacterium]|nr:acetate kinase [Candidatus Portnoybacteria bacterium]
MILVLNSGSQSIKWKVFEPETFKEKARGDIKVKNKTEFRKKTKKELRKIRKEYNILKVGHRVVHGGDQRDPAKITWKIKRKIKKAEKYAPLHNPYNLLGIKTAQSIFKKIPQTAVFDTGFFKDLPIESQTYALPKKIASKYKRMGFHGISHQYLAETAAKKISKPLSEINLITCHLGGGSSITAIKKGKPIDTSMGFTPLEGLTMMTRPGNIDPGIMLELIKEYTPKTLEKMLNEQSGLKALTGEDRMLNILKKNTKQAKTGLNIFCYNIKKYIGAYQAILNKTDAIVFSGKIGYGSKKIRSMITKDLPIDKKTKILSIKTNEELIIAKIIK